VWVCIKSICKALATQSHPPTSGTSWWQTQHWTAPSELDKCGSSLYPVENTCQCVVLSWQITSWQIRAIQLQNILTNSLGYTNWWYYCKNNFWTPKTEYGRNGPSLPNYVTLIKAHKIIFSSLNLLSLKIKCITIGKILYALGCIQKVQCIHRQSSKHYMTQIWWTNTRRHRMIIPVVE
jgi:hypothetical protein